MADKNKSTNQNSLLNKWSIKEGSSLSSGISLTSSLLSGHSSLLKGSDALQQGSKLSFKTTLGPGPSLSSSNLRSTNLTNSLLGSSSLKSSLDVQLATKSNIVLSSSTILPSTKPSISLASDKHSGLNTAKQFLTESTSFARPALTSNLKIDKPIESTLINLSLTQKSDLTTTNKLKGIDTKTSFHEDVRKAHAQKRRIGTSIKTVKKNIIQSSSGEITEQVIKEYAVEPHDYFIKYEREDEYMEVDFPKFIPPSSDMRLNQTIGKSLTEIFSIKRGLINGVSASLISRPNFTNSNDPTRMSITEHVNIVIHYDPEFVLKVALYSRKELNIRTTSNFLLALASSSNSCRVFLKKYYCASIALPSDWIEVAHIFQTLDENNLKRGGLPSALRKAMITKFPEFDKYQLAKYNKESSNKKKKAKSKQLDEKKKTEQQAAVKDKRGGKQRRIFDSDSSDNEDEDDKHIEKQISCISYDEKESKEDLRKQRFTLKQLIRKLHIREPVEHIMCIIGKKYPKTPEEFYKTRLPGIWEEERSGKRMKLPIPETWETQVSLKGNKAQTWEDLIDHKKLPFMAMLRNLRNLIKAGISPKHHNIILRRLTDQRSVVNSKQFPFRFFSAYAAMDELQKNYHKNQLDLQTCAENAEKEKQKSYSNNSNLGKRGRGRGRGIGRGRGRGRGASTASNEPFPWWVLKKMKKAGTEGKSVKEVPYDLALIERYRKALDTAVKIATVHNVHPIKGRTLLICERHNLDKPCSSARDLGKPRTACEVAILMGLMCKYSCEDCEMLVVDNGFATVELDKGTILDNMEKVKNLQIPVTNQNEDDSDVPNSVLLEKLRDRIQVDNLLIFGEDYEPGSQKGRVINKWLRSYRHLVNPNLLFVSVNFSSSKVGIMTDIQPEHENDIYIAGYSDAILRFIAERGNAGQVSHVDKIDQAFELRPTVKSLNKQYDVKLFVVHPQSGPKILPTTPSWKTIRVFISSTFRDMHGERDLLTRFVFPELRSICRNRYINIYEVDLRWGVTEEETKDNRTLDVCLQEVARCQLFVGLLGERYGWIPNSYQVPDTPEFAWVKDYPPGSSVTELEMHLGALSKVKNAHETAFFYFRDNSFENDIPQLFESDFKSESDVHKAKINVLKNKIRRSGLEVFDGYPCHWGGCVDGKPVVAGLEEFGARVLNSLTNAVIKLSPKEDEIFSEDEHINNLQWAYIENCAAEFVGRITLISQIISQIVNIKSGIIGLVGKPGSGKTAVMASTITHYVKNNLNGNNYSIFVNMAGSSPGSNNLTATLRRLEQQINDRFGLNYILPEDFKSLCLKFKDLLEEAGNICPSKLLVFLDGVDQMDSINDPFSLEWIPQPVPDNVIFVITSDHGEKTHKSLKRLAALEITVKELDMWDKAEIVRQTLSKHHKSLSETGFSNQMSLLMLKKEAHNPLYLKLACEELRVFGVFEKISDKLKSLPHTTSQMLQEILNRLEFDHGKQHVSISLCLLACARDGLYPEELFELINWHKQLNETKFEPRDVFSLDFKNQIPSLRFTFLARSIMGFLNPSCTWASLLFLGNKEICTAVKLRYLKGNTNLETRLHKLLAGFFLRQADQHGDNTWKSHNARPFTELPYHLACAANFKELEEILCNHNFIQAKCYLGLAATLMDDFTPASNIVSKGNEKELAHFLSLPRVQQYKKFVSRNIEILVNYPSLEFQQAMNEPTDSFPFKDSLAIKQKGLTVPSYMQWLNKPETESQCSMKLSNFKLPVTCVAISPDGSKFVTGSQDLLVRLYAMTTGKELRFFSGHADQITDLCFVGNSMICSTSADTNVSIWDVENGHRVHTLKGHDRLVNTCASNRQGSLVATGGWDCTVNIWEVVSGKKHCDFDIGSSVNCVDFHPSEERIIVGSWDSLIRIYNYFHKTRIAILRGHSTSVRDIAYSIDGHHAASASLDGEIKIWATDKGSQVGNIRGHSGPISKLTFTPTGKDLITAGEDHQIKIWSGDLGIPLNRLHTENLGAATSVSISPGGSTVAVGYHLGQVQIYDVNTGVKLSKAKVSNCAIRAIKFSNDGSYIYAGCDDGNVQVLEGNQGSQVCSLVGHTKSVLCIDTFELYIATCGEDFTCCLYEDIIKLKSSRVSSPKTVLRGHTAPVSACSFNADGSMLATASRDASIRTYKLYDVFISVDPEPAHILHSCHADWINFCQWSNTGDFLVTASNDFNLKVWDMKDHKEKITITGHSSAINTVAYKYGCIVSGSSDGDVKVWSHKGIPITTLSGHTLRVNSCDIFVTCKKKVKINKTKTSERSWAEVASMEVDDSHEVKKSKTHHNDINVHDVIVASAGDDGDVWIWKPLQANTLANLTGHSDRVLSVAADKHNCIISCSLDNTVRQWQPNLRDEIDLTKHDAAITFVSVSNDGLAAITGSRDGVAKIWHLDAEKIFRRKYSFKAHDKSVNCGCYHGLATDKIVTGGDDNNIYVWGIINRKDGFYVRKQSSFETERPIASLAVNVSNDLIYFTNWTGGIFCINDKNKSHCIHILTNINSNTETLIKDWPLAITIQAHNKEILVGTTSSSVTKLVFNSNFSLLESTENTTVQTDVVDAHIPEYRRPPNWINCIAKFDGIIYAGDSRGQIFIRSTHCEKTIKIHRSAIMAIEIVQGVIFTGSTDCSIKIWTISGSKDVDLNQVGQFFSPSPVTSLKAVGTSKKDGSISLLAGDQLGNIHQLCWWS